MSRARHAAVAALFLAIGGSSAVTGAVDPPGAAVGTAGLVTWPPSTLLLAEVTTGGASASDEFVELVNAGPASVDLVGLEVAYATASGSTITRKATWTTSRSLAPGQHLLIANALGSHAAIADATYSGGLAATGGALVLRPVGGAPIDAVGWGDATNAFVEGTAATAPGAATSIERRPGSTAGNGSDTNDNAIDWFIQAGPNPQNLAAPPTGLPSPTPSADPSPSAEQTPTPSAEPSPEVTPSPTVEPGPTPAPTVEPAPTSTPIASPVPTPTSTPTPLSTASPPPPPTTAPGPTPTPAPAAFPIAQARALADGSTARIVGVLTIPLGSIDDGRGGFVQDDGAGIALYLDAAIEPGAWTAGTLVDAVGVVDARYGQRILRLASTDLGRIAGAPVPAPLAVLTGAAGEGVEGRRIVVSGITVGSPSAMADGTGLLLDDGTGPLRLVVSAEALPATAIPSGTRLSAVGPLGQRDSTGTGAAGYRLHVANAGDLEIAPPPEPSPTPTPQATGSPSPAPGATATPPPAPAPTATPSPTPTPAAPPSIADARARPPGSSVTVVGVVTAEVGRIGTAGLFAIQDETAGIFIRLPAGVASPSRGGWIQFSGVLAVPYGQLEVRGSATGFRVLGTGPLPAAVAVSGSAVAEATEARLVVIEGVVKAKPKRASGGDMSLDLVTAGGTARVMADASSGLTVNALERGRTYRLSGVVGQRESGKKRDDGHRLWLRDAADIAVVAGSSPSPSAPGAPLASPGDDPRPIAEARLVRSGAVSIEATVTAGSALLDATGRRIVVEDASGAIEVLLPTGTVAPEPGSRVGLSGTVVRAYGAPRLRASAVRVLGSGRLPSPLQLHAAPGSAHEWRLVRLSGTLADVHRLGDRWRAEIVAGRDRVPVSGLSGAGIPAPSSAEGRPITVTGIVRRPFPSASDRRFAIVPRGPADLAVGPAPGGAGPAPAGAGASRPGSRSDTGSSPADVDLARLADHVGRTVRVGGLVIDLQADGVSLDDGTAVGRVVLASAAADYLPLLEPGDAVNATGRVERRAAGIVVVVTDPAGLARVGDLGTPVEPPHGPTPGPSRGPGPRLAATADPFGFDGPGATGLAWLVLISVASAAVTLLRRRRLRRAVLERVRIRLTGPGRRPTDGSLPPGAD